MIGGQATTVIPIMWVLAGIVVAFTTLRLYTRVKLVEKMNADDHAFTFSGILFLFFVVFTHVAAEYGFGRDIATLTVDDAVLAVNNEMVGQTFGLLGMAISKWSMGLFLLRIAVKKWHMITVWVFMISFSLVSLTTVILFWVQCLPHPSMWDPRIERTCMLDITPFTILLGVWGVFADFALAILPWLFLWPLHKRHSEHIIIALSMSLGVIAGAFGVKRTIELRGFKDSNYTEATVGVVVWSAAEMAVTMVCTGIPMLRPLYKQWLPSCLRSRRNKYRISGHEQHAGGFALNTTGGGIWSRPDAALAGTSSNRAPKTRIVLRRKSDPDDSVLNPLPLRDASLDVGACGRGDSMAVDVEAQGGVHAKCTMPGGMQYAVQREQARYWTRNW